MKTLIRGLKILGALLAVLVVMAVSSVYLVPESTIRWVIDLERQRSSLVRKQIDFPDGTHYVYLEGGQGEPLMLLHGFGGDKDNFTRVARFLTPHFHVIIPDHVGFGESSHPAQADYTPVAQANRLADLAKALGIQQLHLAGNSMGGQIALSYAVLHPAEVKSLWVLDPAGIWTAPESELQRYVRETGRNPLIAKTEDDFAAIFALVMNDPPFVPRPMLNVLAQDRIRNYDLEDRIIRLLRDDSVEKRITGLATPTLIVWGDKDRLIHVKTAEILNKLLPNSQVIILPGVGHVPMIERPRQSAEDYLRFQGIAMH